MGVFGDQEIRTYKDYDCLREYKQIAKRAVELIETAKREGLLSLEDLIDEKKYRERDILENGLRFIVDGTDYELIDKILSNIINQEKDEFKRMLKEIQRDAILYIQAGSETNLLNHVINSHSGFTIENDPIFKYGNY